MNANMNDNIRKMANETTMTEKDIVLSLHNRAEKGEKLDLGKIKRVNEENNLRGY